MVPPPPPIKDPSDGTYPNSLAYTLRSTSSYTRGCIYVLDWSSHEKHALQGRLLLTRMPPNATPKWSIDGCLTVEPIPGMIQLVPGVPFIQLVDGHPTTVACLQTTASLCKYRGIDKQVQALTKTLCDLSFSTVHEGKVTMDPVYTLPRLKWNDWTAKPSADLMTGLIILHQRSSKEMDEAASCLLSLGAEGVLPGRYIESLLRVFKQFTHTLPSGYMGGKFSMYSPL